MLAYAPIVFVLLLIEPTLLPFLLLGIPIIAFSCTFPDIDMRLKNFTPIKHRGITHTVWFALFIGFLVLPAIYAAGWYATTALPSHVGMRDVYAFLAFGWFLGVYGTLSHLMGDVITPTGLRPLKPVSDRRFVRTMTVAGQTSKAANGYWNRALHILGDTAVISAFILGYPPTRNTIFGFVWSLTELV